METNETNSSEQLATATAEVATSPKEEEIKNPVAYAKAYKEKADRIQLKLMEAESALSEMKAKIETLESKHSAISSSIKKQLALGALKEAGIDDEEMVNVFAKDLLEKIELDDNFAPKDSSYLERAKTLSAKMTVKKSVILPPPSANVGDVQLSWREELKQKINK